MILFRITVDSILLSNAYMTILWQMATYMGYIMLNNINT